MTSAVPGVSVCHCSRCDVPFLADAESGGPQAGFFLLCPGCTRVSRSVLRELLLLFGLGGLALWIACGLA